MRPPTRYRKFSDYLKSRFGGLVRKVSVDAGFTCPNRDGSLSREGCVFCRPRSFAPAFSGLSPVEQLRIQVDRGRDRGITRFMAYFQAYSNTYAPLPELRRAYDAVRAFPEIRALAIGTRPDCVDADVLELIAGYAADYEVWLEYGLQSIHDGTLARLNRGHAAAAFFRAVDLTRRHPALKICAHVILGLPGEDETQEAETALALARLRPEGVKLHPLYIVSGTALARDWEAGKYKPLPRGEYARRAARFLERLPANTVIQRLTADCPAEWLLAPEWLADKSAVIREIECCLEREDTCQGKLFRA